MGRDIAHQTYPHSFSLLISDTFMLIIELMFIYRHIWMKRRELGWVGGYAKIVSSVSYCQNFSHDNEKELKKYFNTYIV